MLKSIKLNPESERNVASRQYSSSQHVDIEEPQIKERSRVENLKVPTVVTAYNAEETSWHALTGINLHQRHQRRETRLISYVTRPACVYPCLLMKEMKHGA